MRRRGARRCSSRTTRTRRRAARELGAETLDDPGGGQGAAVAAALAETRLGAGARRQRGRAVRRATATCGRSRESPSWARSDSWRPPTARRTRSPSHVPRFSRRLYGPGSAGRFRAHGEANGVAVVAAAIPNLADDVDTLDDLERMELRVGPRTQAALEPASRGGDEGRAPLRRRRRRPVSRADSSRPSVRRA